MRKLLAVTVLLAWPVWATQIKDTVYYASNGQLAEGTVIIAWPSFTTGTGRTVVGGKNTFRLVSGALNVVLEANDTAIPAGTSYTVQYQFSNGGRAAEFWVVPTSATPKTVADVRVLRAPVPQMMVNLEQLQPTGATAGQAILWNGTTYAPGDVAAGGAVESVNGETGTVVLDYADVGAAAAGHTHTYGSLSGLPTLGDAAAKNVGTASGTVAAGDDSRLADARTPTAHASTHRNGGSDEIATATPAANAIPKAGSGGTLAADWSAPELLRYRKVEVSAEQIKNFVAVPIELIPAQGANTVVIPTLILFVYNAGATAYANCSFNCTGYFRISSTSLTIPLDSMAYVGGSAPPGLLKGADKTFMWTYITYFDWSGPTRTLTDFANAPFTFSGNDSNPATGTGTLTVHIWYRVLSI